MGIARFEKSGHLQDVQVFSAQPALKQAIFIYSSPDPELFSEIFMKFTLMLLVLTVERN